MWVSEVIRKSHNQNLLLYHLVCPAKFRAEIFSSAVEESLRKVCEGISQRYEINYVEIGSDIDHVHFLIQSIPMMMPSQIVRITKSITARELLTRHTEIKKKLWGGKFWTRGYYINTVGASGNEEAIRRYVKNQGKEYKQISRHQIGLFDGFMNG